MCVFLPVSELRLIVLVLIPSSLLLLFIPLRVKCFISAPCHGVEPFSEPDVAYVHPGNVALIAWYWRITN